MATTTDETKKAEGAGSEAPVPVERRTCRVPLTPEEVQAKGRALAAVLREEAGVEASKEQMAKDFRERMKRLEQRKQALRSDLEDGCEERMVDCKVVMDFSRNMVLYRRCDTDEVVDGRAMEQGERQAQIDFPEGKPEEAKPNGEAKPKKKRGKKGEQG